MYAMLLCSFVATPPLRSDFMLPLIPKMDSVGFQQVLTLEARLDYAYFAYERISQFTYLQ